MRLSVGRLKRFHETLSGDGSGTWSRYFRCSDLDTRPHLTRIDSILILASKSPLPLGALALCVVVVSLFYDDYKSALPQYVEPTFYSAVVLTAFFYRNVMSLGFASGPKVLLLRRFHTELHPTYPLTRVFHRLVERGFQVVTLRDSIVDRDRDTFSGVDAAARLASGLVNEFVYYGCFIAVPILLLFWNQSDAFRQSSAVTGWWLILLLEGALTTLAWYLGWWRDGGFFKRVRKSGKANSLSKGAPLFALQARAFRAGKFRHRGQLGMKIIRGDDQRWLEEVCLLMDQSDIVVVDLSNPSDNIRLEIEALSRRYGSCVPVWMRMANQVSAVEPGRHSYKVLSVEFPGKPIELTYPPRSSKGDYLSGVEAGFNFREFQAAAALAATLKAVGWKGLGHPLATQH